MLGRPERQREMIRDGYGGGWYGSTPHAELSRSYSNERTWEDKKVRERKLRYQQSCWDQSFGHELCDEAMKVKKY